MVAIRRTSDLSYLPSRLGVWSIGVNSVKTKPSPAVVRGLTCYEDYTIIVLPRAEDLKVALTLWETSIGLE